MQAAGFVLVGGLSTRMGQDKALLSSGRHPLVTDVAKQVSGAAGSVALVGKSEGYRNLGLDCISDLRPGLGPLAGIEAALLSQRGEWNLIVACDMPGLAVDFLQALLDQARQTEAVCTVTRDVAGHIHPLCAVYRQGCLPVVQRALDSQQLRLMDLIEALHANFYETNRLVTNVNTPEEWSAWREQQTSGKGVPLAAPHGN